MEDPCIINKQLKQKFANNPQNIHKNYKAIMQTIVALINSPVGPKTTHFWGPVCNTGFVVQGIIDWDRPAEKISRNM